MKSRFIQDIEAFSRQIGERLSSTYEGKIIIDEAINRAVKKLVVFRYWRG